MSKAKLLSALEPIVLFLQEHPMGDAPAMQIKLEETFPWESPFMQTVAQLVRQGVAEGWLCERENAGIRFSRLHKAADESGFSIDAVHMDRPGPGHTHPRGEVDLCFPVAGTPQFDGRTPGWTVYPPGSWHIPTVTGGAMDILYFLPGGAIQFGEPGT